MSLITLPQVKLIALFKTLRTILGLTQRDLSKETGISLSTLNRFERNGGGISLNSATMLLKYYESKNIVFTELPDKKISVVFEIESLNL